MNVVYAESLNKKHYAMFNEIISLNHPKFKSLGDKELNLFRNMVDYLNIEQLVEESFAPRHEELCNEMNIQLQYTHVPGGHHLDLSDNSDVKCCIHKSRERACQSTLSGLTVDHKTTVTIKSSDDGEGKLGSLRTVIWNDVIGRIEYYYFMKDVWEVWAKNSKTFSLTSPRNGIITNAQPYKCDSFDELVMMTDSKMEKIVEERTRIPVLWDIFGE
jgi:hypothetical protein